MYNSYNIIRVSNDEITQQLEISAKPMYILLANRLVQSTNQLAPSLMFE